MKEGERQVRAPDVSNKFANWILVYLDDDGVAPTHSEESAESEERDAERIVDEEITNI